MSEVTYSFNAYDSGGEVWDTNPANMVDGSEDTYASTWWDTDIVQLCTGNTCAGTNLGTISKVEIRSLNWGSQIGISCTYRPVFGGISDGDDNTQIMQPPAVQAWGDYIDITSNTNAPGTWDWDDVDNLDLDVQVTTGSFKTAYMCKIEIRVTYETLAGGATGSMTPRSNYWGDL